MVRKRNRCSVEGCINFVVSHGLCDKHRIRLKRHGHLEQTRPKDWGERYSHPLYQIWRGRRRSEPPLCEEWRNDFQKFVQDVGERPGKKYKLHVVDRTKEVGPENVEWKESFAVNSESKREKARLYARSHRANNKEKYKDKWLQKKYGITLSEYKKMFEDQGLGCAICGTKEFEVEHKQTKGMSNMAVDHCHETNVVRGILCINCNRALGLFKDSVEIISSAKRYLEESNIIRQG